MSEARDLFEAIAELVNGGDHEIRPAKVALSNALVSVIISHSRTWQDVEAGLDEAHAALDHIAEDLWRKGRRATRRRRLC